MKKTEAADSIIGLCNGILLKGIQPKLPNLTAKDWDEALSLGKQSFRSSHEILEYA